MTSLGLRAWLLFMRFAAMSGSNPVVGNYYFLEVSHSVAGASRAIQLLQLTALDSLLRLPWCLGFIGIVYCM